MRTRYGVSPWLLQFPDSRRPSYPKATGEAAADVVIIGAGLTGCTTAYVCAAAGLNVRVLEAQRVGHGASGRSGGLLLPEPGPAFRDLAGAHGVRIARSAFESWRKAALDGAALLRRLGIKAGLEPYALVTIATADGERLLRRENDAREEAGLDVAWLGRKPLQRATGLDAPAALKVGDAFALDPYRATVGLAQAAAKRGAKFFEQSRVRKVRFSRKDAEVTTGDATVRTTAVVVTTGSAPAEFKQLRRHFAHKETYLTLTEPLSAAMKKAAMRTGVIVGDTRAPRHHLRATSDGRLLIVGADQRETPERNRKAVLVQRTGQLMYEALLTYPVIAGLRPEFGWEAAYAEPADGLPYIGAHRNFPHHLFALGGSGDSVTGAFLAARIILRAVQGVPAKEDAVFSWNR